MTNIFNKPAGWPKLYDEEKFVLAIVGFINEHKITTVPRNSNFRCRYMDVYLRLSFRTFDGKRYPTIELARINVIDKYQRKGMLSALLKLLEANAKDRYMFIENVSERGQFAIYHRRGFTLIPMEQTCFFKFDRATPSTSILNYIRSITPAPEPEPLHVDLSVPKETHAFLSRKAKQAGYKSVASYLLHLAGANEIDGDKARELHAHAVHGVEVRISKGIDDVPFTFKQLIEPQDYASANKPTLIQAEKMFHANCYSQHVSRVAKYPNRYRRNPNVW